MFARRSLLIELGRRWCVVAIVIGAVIVGSPNKLVPTILAGSGPAFSPLADTGRKPSFRAVKARFDAHSGAFWYLPQCHLERLSGGSIPV